MSPTYFLIQLYTVTWLTLTPCILRNFLTLRKDSPVK